jgi:hypothetical protein
VEQTLMIRKLLVAFLLALFVLAASLLGGPFFPWWWPAVPGLLAGFWKPGATRAFFAAFLGAALGWGAVAIYLDWRNAGLLSARIAAMFHLPGAAGLIAATALVGGVTAGLGALVGNHFRLFWRSLSEALAAENVILPPDDSLAGVKRPRPPGP